MGRKRKRNKNKVYNTSNTPIVAPSQVGFNASIPGVTLVVTENSTDINLCQKLINECKPSYYHKFLILNSETYSKSYILNAISEFVQPFTLKPVYYNETKESTYFLATNCLKVIMKIVGNKCKVPHATDGSKEFKLAIFVNCLLKKDVPEVNTFKNICEVLNKLYDPITNELNLSDFSNLADIINYSPLVDQKIFEYVIIQAAKLKTKHLRLSKNYLKNLCSIDLLKDTLEILDISYNNLETISCLDELKECTKLKVLHLTDNPLCQNYNSHNYIQDVKKYCPYLEELDGVNIVSPRYIKNFMCTPEAKYLASQFLEHFFTVYDSSNRVDLVDLYDINALFSVTSNIIPNQSNSNMVKLGHYGIHNPYAVYGVAEIMKLFQEFPKSYHDSYGMVCDVPYYTSTNALLVVTGVFREYSQILSFSRNFYFRRIGDKFLIQNEQLHVNNAEDFQVESSFSFPTDFQYTGNPVPFFKDQYKQFENAMQTITGMNLEYCQKYLVYCNYDLKKALSLFAELHVRNEIPKEAFETQNFRSTHSRGFCKTLREKVLKTQGNIALKSIWTAFNNGRIEDANDPPMKINRSINRMYRNPNVPVDFKDYLDTPESITFTQQPITSLSSNVEQLRESFKAFIEREAQADKSMKMDKPLLSQPTKFPKKKIFPASRTVSKSSQTNPLLNLAHKINRNKEMVLKELQKSIELLNEKTKLLPTPPLDLLSQPAVASSQQTNTHLRIVQPRLTAAAFFNPQQTFANVEPDRCDSIAGTKEMQLSKHTNIPQKNICLQTTNSTENTGNSNKLISITGTLTSSDITQLRENVQKEKHRLRNLKASLNNPNDKIPNKNLEKNKGSSSQKTNSKNVPLTNKGDLPVDDINVDSMTKSKETSLISENKISNDLEKKTDDKKNRPSHKKKIKESVSRPDSKHSDEKETRTNDNKFVPDKVSSQTNTNSKRKLCEEETSDKTISQNSIKVADQHNVNKVSKQEKVESSSSASNVPTYVKPKKIKKKSSRENRPKELKEEIRATCSNDSTDGHNPNNKITLNNIKEISATSSSDSADDHDPNSKTVNTSLSKNTSNKIKLKEQISATSSSDSADDRDPNSKSVKNSSHKIKLKEHISTKRSSDCKDGHNPNNLTVDTSTSKNTSNKSKLKEEIRATSSSDFKDDLDPNRKTVNTSLSKDTSNKIKLKEQISASSSSDSADDRGPNSKTVKTSSHKIKLKEHISTKRSSNCKDDHDPNSKKVNTSITKNTSNKRKLNEEMYATCSSDSTDESSNRVKSKSSKRPKGSEQTITNEKVVKKTEAQHSGTHKKLVIRLHNLSESEIEKLINKPLSSSKTCLSQETPQKLDDVTLSAFTDNGNDKHIEIPVKNEIKINLKPVKETMLVAESTIPSPQVKSALTNEELMVILEETNPPNALKSKPKTNTKLEEESQSDVNIISLINNETEDKMQSKESGLTNEELMVILEETNPPNALKSEPNPTLLKKVNIQLEAGSKSDVSLNNNEPDAKTQSQESEQLHSEALNRKAVAKIDPIKLKDIGICTDDVTKDKNDFAEQFTMSSKYNKNEQTILDPEEKIQVINMEQNSECYREVNNELKISVNDRQENNGKQSVSIDLKEIDQIDSGQYPKVKFGETHQEVKLKDEEIDLNTTQNLEPKLKLENQNIDGDESPLNFWSIEIDDDDDDNIV